MKKRIRKMISIFLIMFSMFENGLNGFVFAQEKSQISTDIKNYWANEMIKKWLDKGIVNGYEDDTFKPDNEITRAEFIKIVNNIFGFVEKSSDNFKDVNSTEWYSDEFTKAKARGYIKGYEDGTIKPNDPITREEAATILARVFELKGEETTANLADSSTVQNYAKGYVNVLVKKGVINGYQDGTFKPKNNIKRAEVVKMIDKLVTSYYNKAGVYTDGTIVGNVVINTKDVVLADMTIKGDLYITQGVGNGDVNLEGVTVEGTTYVNGGGENSIHINNSKLNTVKVNKKDGRIRLEAKGNTTITNVEVINIAKIEMEKSVTITNLNVSQDAKGTIINGEGKIENTKVLAENVMLNGKTVPKEGTTTIMVTPASTITSGGSGGGSARSTVSKSNDANISNLVIDEFGLTQKFDFSVTEYTTLIYMTTPSININATVNSSVYQKLTINGEIVGSGVTKTLNINELKEINNTVKPVSIIVTAEDGTQKTYTININYTTKEYTGVVGVLPKITMEIVKNSISAEKFDVYLWYTDLNRIVGGVTSHDFLLEKGSKGENYIELDESNFVVGGTNNKEGYYTIVPTQPLQSGEYRLMFSKPGHGVYYQNITIPKKYSITVASVVYGIANIQVDKETASPKEIATINISDIEIGKQIKNLTVLGSVYGSISIEEIKPKEIYTFDMPEEEVIITLELEQIETLIQLDELYKKLLFCNLDILNKYICKNVII